MSVDDFEDDEFKDLYGQELDDDENQGPDKDLRDDNIKDNPVEREVDDEEEQNMKQGASIVDADENEKVRESNNQSENYEQNIDDTKATTPTKPYDQEPHEESAMKRTTRDDPFVKDDGKMFIGGLNWDTTDEGLRGYFSKYGEVQDCTIMRDSVSGRSRGFAFLTFDDPKSVDAVIKEEHWLDGKIIDPKRAIPREEQTKTAKMFVGGIPQDCSEEEFQDYFGQFGRVLDATLMIDKDTGRPRGFGFITFENDQAVEIAIRKDPIVIKGKTVEVRRATPKGGGRDRGQDSRNSHSSNNNANMWNPMAFSGMGNEQSTTMMANYFRQMQQYFQAMQSMGRPALMTQMSNPLMAQMMSQMAAGEYRPAMHTNNDKTDDGEQGSEHNANYTGFFGGNSSGYRSRYNSRRDTKSGYRPQRGGYHPYQR